MDQIKGIGYDGKRWLLIDAVTQKSVKRGQVLTDFRGDKQMVRDGTAPHKAGSTGRIYMTSGRAFYPVVYGCQWVRL